MKHPLTRELYDYWNGRRGEEAMPERADIDPAAIRRILADTFVLAVEPGQNPRFRVAGTKVCELFGRELRGDDFMGLWGEADARQVREIVAPVMGSCARSSSSSCRCPITVRAGSACSVRWCPWSSRSGSARGRRNASTSEW
jgi:hypothetical protein